MAQLTSQQQAQLAQQAMYQMGGFMGGGGGGAGGAGLMAANPYGAAIGAAAGVATAALEDKVPQNQSSSYTVGYDNSGWAVTIGDGSTAQVDQIKTPNPSVTTAAKGLSGLLQNPLFLVGLAVAIGAVVYYNSK